MRQEEVKAHVCLWGEGNLCNKETTWPKAQEKVIEEKENQSIGGLCMKNPISCYSRDTGSENAVSLI